ncbi:unnamed protein product [Scytosiphon promiscuus]
MLDGMDTGEGQRSSAHKSSLRLLPQENNGHEKKEQPLRSRRFPFFVSICRPLLPRCGTRARALHLSGRVLRGVHGMIGFCNAECVGLVASLLVRAEIGSQTTSRFSLIFLDCPGRALPISFFEVAKRRRGLCVWYGGTREGTKVDVKPTV